MASIETEKQNDDGSKFVNQQTSTAKSVPIYNASSSHQHSHECNDPSHHHDYPLFFDQNDEDSSAATAKTRRLMKHKAKKNQNQDVTRSEAIPGHQGDKNIDDLLNFINGPSSANNKTNSKKPKEKPTKTN